MVAVPLTLVLLACATPTPDAYAIGVANLLERALSDTVARVRQGAEDPARTWDGAVAYDGRVEAPGGFPGLSEPWAGAFDLSLAPRDDAPTTWRLDLHGEDVRVRRFVANCSDWSCDVPDPALHGGCAVDWDPEDYTFALDLDGTLDFTDDPPAEAGEADYAWWSPASFEARVEGHVEDANAVVVATYDELDEYSTFLSVRLSLDGVPANEVQCGNSD